MPSTRNKKEISTGVHLDVFLLFFFVVTCIITRYWTLYWCRSLGDLDHHSRLHRCVRNWKVGYQLTHKVLSQFRSTLVCCWDCAVLISLTLILYWLISIYGTEPYLRDFTNITWTLACIWILLFISFKLGTMIDADERYSFILVLNGHKLHLMSQGNEKARTILL